MNLEGPIYPRWDFRSIIQSSSSSTEIWRSMLREPLKELLDYWSQSGRPENLREVYCRGIYEGILRDRWPCFQLSLIEEYPEFYSCVRAGLDQAWSGLRFCLHYGEEGPCLLIDSQMGEPLDFSADQKRQILELLRYRFTVSLLINGEESTVGILPSKRARDIYHRIFWLDSAQLNSTPPATTES